MDKIILSLTLIGALTFNSAIGVIANPDSPNKKVRLKKISIEERMEEEEGNEDENEETSILVEDTLEPKCSCEGKDYLNKDEKNKKEQTNKSEKSDEDKKREESN